MSWNPMGEPGGEPPDYVEPYPPPYGQTGDYVPQPEYGQPGDVEPYPQAHAPPPASYGPPPAYAQPVQYTPPQYEPQAVGWQPGYGPQDAEPDDERPSGGRMVTPLRLVGLVALVVSGAVAAVSLFVLRGSQSIPITVAALAIFGVTATLIGIAFAAAGVRAARDGSVVRAFAGGLVGGLFVLIASGAAASAVIFALLSRS